MVLVVVDSDVVLFIEESFGSAGFTSVLFVEVDEDSLVVAGALLLAGAGEELLGTGTGTTVVLDEAGGAC